MLLDQRYIACTQCDTKEDAIGREMGVNFIGHCIVATHSANLSGHRHVFYHDPTRKYSEEHRRCCMTINAVERAFHQFGTDYDCIVIPVHQLHTCSSSSSTLSQSTQRQQGETERQIVWKELWSYVPDSASCAPTVSPAPLPPPSSSSTRRTRARGPSSSPPPISEQKMRRKLKARET